MKKRPDSSEQVVIDVKNVATELFYLPCKLEFFPAEHHIDLVATNLEKNSAS